MAPGARLKLALRHGVLLGALACAASAASAQDNGGLRLTFDISQELRSQSNPGLDIPAGANRTLALTRLQLGLSMRTGVQDLSFSFGGTFEAGRGRDRGLSSPDVTFRYAREGVASSLDLTAFRRERGVDTLDLVGAFDPLGNPVLTIASGRGIQRQTGGSLGLTLGRDRPFGASFLLSRTDTDYTNTTDPALVDNRRLSGRANFRFDLSPVTALTIGTALSRLQEVGAAPSRTRTVTLGLTNERRNGRVSIDATVARTNGQQRESLSLGRRFDLPGGSLQLRVGVSGKIAGGSVLVGGIDWQHLWPGGQIGVSLDRRVGGTDRDAEAEATSLSLSMTRELTPVFSANFGASLQDSVLTRTGVRTRGTQMSASLRYAVTPDWGVDLGATRRTRDETGTGRASSNTVFLRLSRSFEARF